MAWPKQLEFPVIRAWKTQGGIWECGAGESGLEVSNERLQGGFDVGDVSLHLVQTVLVLVPVLAVLDAVCQSLLLKLARGVDAFTLGRRG